MIKMSYGNGPPSWVYKNQMSRQASDYQYQISLLRKKIEELESENERLRARIQELENI